MSTAKQISKLVRQVFDFGPNPTVEDVMAKANKLAYALEDEVILEWDSKAGNWHVDRDALSRLLRTMNKRDRALLHEAIRLLTVDRP